jgi:hypothetical protein
MLRREVEAFDGGSIPVPHGGSNIIVLDPSG